MRVKVRSMTAGPWGIPIPAGGTGMVPDEIGRAMVKAGAAVEIAAEAEPFEEPALVVETQTAALEPAEETAVLKDPPKRRRAHATVQKPGVPA